MINVQLQFTRLELIIVPFDGPSPQYCPTLSVPRPGSACSDLLQQHRPLKCVCCRVLDLNVSRLSLCGVYKQERKSPSVNCLFVFCSVKTNKRFICIDKRRRGSTGGLLFCFVGADKVGIRVLGAGFGSTLELLFKASERIPARVIYKGTAVELKRKLRKGQRNR